LSEDDGEKVMTGTKCIHMFHYECCMQWVEKGNDHCPYCREDMMTAEELVEAAREELGEARIEKMIRINQDAARRLAAMQNIDSRIQQNQTTPQTEHQGTNSTVQDPETPTVLDSSNTSDSNNEVAPAEAEAEGEDQRANVPATTSNTPTDFDFDADTSSPDEETCLASTSPSDTPADLDAENSSPVAEPSLAADESRSGTNEGSLPPESNTVEEKQQHPARADEVPDEVEGDLAGDSTSQSREAAGSHE
jgi:type II secretory pathway pseudopilin PulG